MAQPFGYQQTPAVPDSTYDFNRHVVCFDSHLG
jgi:hypothetical protein